MTERWDGHLACEEVCVGLGRRGGRSRGGMGGGVWGGGGWGGGEGGWRGWVGSWVLPSSTRILDHVHRSSNWPLDPGEAGNLVLFLPILWEEPVLDPSSCLTRPVWRQTVISLKDSQLLTFFTIRCYLMKLNDRYEAACEKSLLDCSTTTISYTLICQQF